MFALDRLQVTSVLGSVRFPGLIRSGERIEAFVGPVTQHVFEDFLQVLGFERLQVDALGRLIGFIEQADEQVHSPVMIDRSQHGIEVHRAVEEAPGHIPHQGAQKRVDRHHVPAARKRNVREIFVAFETELAGCERLIAQFRSLGHALGGRCCCRGHSIPLFVKNLIFVESRSILISSCQYRLIL
jgi:hypothetical protein